MKGKIMKNKIMLITYANSLGKNLQELHWVLNQYFKDQISSVHLLPFYPSSADRGFAPMTYQEVDSEFGTFDDIELLASDYDLMVDFMINHISRSSTYFKDFKALKTASPYYDLFLKVTDFYGGRRPSQAEIDLIYKRKPEAPFQEVTFADGSKEEVWSTFDDEQIDLDIRTKTTKQFIEDNLRFLCQKGAKVIRADAFAYVTKKEKTNCFFVEPDTWDILNDCKSILDDYGVTLLPEIHEHYSIQQKIDQKGYYAYDFALPMLVLHALYSGDKTRLVHWFNIAPKKQFTTLDTHDGIGVVDVKDLMTDEEIAFTREALFSKGANVKRIYNSTSYNNLDIYQINCTYYSALGDKDQSYLLARAIQFFAPGIPQVYYVGMLAGKNDVELIEKTKNGRDINRHDYSLEEIAQEVRRPVVQKIMAMMSFRNNHPAFDGKMSIVKEDSREHLKIIWSNDDVKCKLEADLKTHFFEITSYENGQWQKIM